MHFQLNKKKFWNKFDVYAYSFTYLFLNHPVIWFEIFIIKNFWLKESKCHYNLPLPEYICRYHISKESPNIQNNRFSNKNLFLQRLTSLTLYVWLYAGLVLTMLSITKNNFVKSFLFKNIFNLNLHNICNKNNKMQHLLKPISYSR